MNESDDGVAGGWLSMEYAHNQTTFIDHNENKQIMQFNDFGNTVSIQDGEGHAQHARYALNTEADAQNNTDANKKSNQMRLSSKLQNTVANLLADSGFERYSTWTLIDSAVARSISPTAYMGSSSLAMTRASAGTDSGIYTTFTAEPGASYTFSAYVKTGNGGNAYIALYDGSTTVKSDNLTPNTAWTRLQVSYTNTSQSSKTLFARFMTGSAGISYIDCAQIEKAPTASRYNLIQNGDFRTTTDWSSSAGRTTLPADTATVKYHEGQPPQLSDDVYILAGSMSAGNRISQTVKVSGSEGDTFVLSGSYEREKDDGIFEAAAFTMGEWDGFETTVYVEDTFVDAVYVYAEYDSTKVPVPGYVPDLYAVYTMTSGAEVSTEQNFGSKTSGAYSVLAKGSDGNSVIYRIAQEKDGYTYSQDYTVHFKRVPTLTGITVKDQEGTDQAPTQKFTGEIKDYTYKVLETVTDVVIDAQPLLESYSVTVNGEPCGDGGVSIPVNGDTEVEIVVSSGDFAYTNTYTVTIQPGTGSKMSFTALKDVTVEVVNSNGVIMPFTTHKEGTTQHRYYYTLVPGETYSYIATKDTYYHIADDFELADLTTNSINIDFSSMGDWLSELALGSGRSSNKKGTVPLTEEFDPAVHSYRAFYPDTEHNLYVWATQSANISVDSIAAIYTQNFSSDLYHGKEYSRRKKYNKNQTQK